VVRCILQRHETSDLLPATRLHLWMFPLLPKNAIELWQHRSISPFMKSEPSWSIHLPKAPAVNTACIGNQIFNTIRFLRGSSCPNHNTRCVRENLECISSNMNLGCRCYHKVGAALACSKRFQARHKVKKYSLLE
jgi:hypothetical protein